MSKQQEGTIEGRAQLADFSGSGALRWERGESGEAVLTGLWQPDEPEQAYDALHRLYMARERIEFRGPVHDRKRGDASEETREVIILEWSNEDHPAALKLQEAQEGS